MQGLYIGLALLSFAVLIGLGRYLHNQEEQFEAQRERDLYDAEQFKRELLQRQHGERVEARQAQNAR